MVQPPGVVDVFTAVILAVGVYCLTRLVAARRWRRPTHYDVNVGHVLMALGMVGMLQPGWLALPTGAGETGFGLLAAWLAVRSGRAVVAAGGPGGFSGPAGLPARHYAVHAVMAGSMVYMYAIGMSPGVHGPVPGAGAGSPLVTLVFLMVLLGSAVFQLDGLNRLRPAVGVALAASRSVVAAGDRRWLAPRLEVGCHLAMCLVMAYMLVLVV